MLVIEESLDEYKEWISLQPKKNHSSQPGGKIKRTIKKGRKTRKTKMYKKIRTNRKK